jgi:hypothetical protein
VKTVRSLAIVAFLGIGAGFGWVSAQGFVNTESGHLTAQDYADIQQLFWRYNQGSDFRDADLFLSAFTDDAVFNDGQQEYVGKGQLAALRVERHAGESGDNGRRHWNSSYRITPSDEGATGLVYWLVVDVSTSPPKAVLSGYYEDVYVKTSAGWRIKTRTIKRDDS